MLCASCAFSLMPFSSCLFLLACLNSSNLPGQLLTFRTFAYALHFTCLPFLVSPHSLLTRSQSLQQMAPSLLALSFSLLMSVRFSWYHDHFLSLARFFTCQPLRSPNIGLPRLKSLLSPCGPARCPPNSHAFLGTLGPSSLHSLLRRYYLTRGIWALLHGMAAADVLYDCLPLYHSVQVPRGGSVEGGLGTGDHRVHSLQGNIMGVGQCLIYGLTVVPRSFQPAASGMIASY